MSARKACLALASGLAFLFSCGARQPGESERGAGGADGTDAGGAFQSVGTADGGAVRFRVETVVGNLQVPWSIVFAPDGRMLFTERPGRVRVFEQGRLRPEPLATIPDVEESSESGLMGLILLLEYTPAVAPASGTFYRGSAFPQFKGNFFFGNLRGECVIRVVLEGRRVVKEERLLEKQYGRIRDVVEGPDGALYFSTSNRDGRGQPKLSDDRIMRLVPEGTK